MIAGLELGEHGGDQRLVGELHAASERVAEELAAELAEEVLAARGCEVGAEAVEALDGGAVWQVRAGVNREPGRILAAGAADGIETLQRKTERIDPPVASGAFFVAAVTFDELALGESGGRFLGQDGHAFRRTRQFLTEDDFAEPVAAQDGTGARGAALFREGAGKSEDASTALRANAIDAPPVIPFRIEAVMLRERPVHERVIRIEQRKHGAVLLEQIHEEAHGLLLHVAPQTDERREMALALFIERRDIAHVQPLASKLRGKTAHLRILHHAPGLRRQHFGIAQRAIHGEGSQFIVRRRRPEKVAEARGEFPIIHRAGLVRRFLAAIQERGRGEHADKHEAWLEGHETGDLLFREGTPPSLLRKGEHGGFLRLDDGLLLLLEFRGGGQDGLAHRLECVGLGVLRGVLP